MRSLVLPNRTRLFENVGVMTAEPAPSSLGKPSWLALHAAVDYATFWPVLEATVQRHVPCASVALFAEIVDQSIPQLFFSTGGVYESLPVAQCRAMIQQSHLLAYLRANRGVPVVHWSDYGGTKAQHQATPHFRRFMAPMGWAWFICLAFWRRRRLFGALLLHRREAEGDFTTAERACLDHLWPELNVALERLHRTQALAARLRAIERWSAEGLRPRLLLDWDLKVVHRTDAAVTTCLRWLHGSSADRRLQAGAHFAVPPAVLRAGRRLKERLFRCIEAWETVPGDLAESVTHPHAAGLSARIRPVGQDRRLPAWPMLAVDFFEAAARRPPDGAAGWARLTQTERELATVAAEGLSTMEIANRLHKTAGTVKTQLSRLYAKLDVRSRAQLVAQLRG